MLNRGFRRLTVSIDEVRAHNRELSDGLLNTPFEYALAFDTALKNVIKALPNRPRHELDDEVMYYCAFVGSFGEFACNPRTLSSSHLNHMVALEGIVTKCSLVRPKVIKSVHYSELGNKFVSREYKDQTMTVGATTTSVYPTEDEDGYPVRIFAVSVFSVCSLYLAHYRIRLLHLPRPPDNFDTRNARASASRPASSRSRRHTRR
jgi:DNA replication licensing factor MCM3